jgi:hypothetical protein
VDPSAGLKAMLGVGSTATQPASPQMNNDFPPPPPPQPPSAADKLMQLMASQVQHQQSGQQIFQQPTVSAFNFSYTEEGKEAPEPSQVPMPHQGMAPHYFPPPPPMPHMMMGPYGYMPPPPMPPQMMGHPPMPLGVPPPQHAPNGNYGRGGRQTGNGVPPPPTVVSDDEFPPLGASPPSKNKKEESAKGPEPIPEKPKVPSANFLVPSIVKSGKK